MSAPTWDGRIAVSPSELTLGGPSIYGAADFFSFFSSGRPATIPRLGNAVLFSAQFEGVTEDHGYKVKGPGLPRLLGKDSQPVMIGTEEYRPLQGGNIAVVDPSVVYYPVFFGFQITYGHWIVDVIPAALWLRSMFSDLKIRLVCQGSIPSFGREYAEVFGFEIITDQEISPGGHLFLASSRSRAHDYVDTMMVRRHFMPAVDQIYSDRGRNPHRRVFVSKSLARNGENMRVLNNRVEVEGIFAEMGFEIVNSENLSMQQKIDLYGDAAILAGEAGSNLHHSVFMAPGTKVIVMNSGRQDHLIQASFCAAMDQPCTYVIGPPDNDHWDSNFTIDMGELRKAIADVLT